MYSITLLNMLIENFKGIKSRTIDFTNKTIINGENGSGKTTVYDAFLWLLFGKDSTGRKEFELRPLDAENNAIKGLVLSVHGDISFDGTVHSLHKEHCEKANKKGQVKGYETLCWIDEVPKKISEYNAWITERIDEDTFKLLTDTRFFNDNKKFGWEKRRGLLASFANLTDIAETLKDKFAALIAKLNGREIKDYKKVLTDHKKLHEEERDKINTRIDENQKQLNDYVGGDTSENESKREKLNTELQLLENNRLSIVQNEAARQTKLDTMNNLKADRATRESELKNDTSAVQKFMDERTANHNAVENKKQEYMQTQNDIRHEKTEIEGIKQTMNTHTRTLAGIRGRYTVLEDADYSGETCTACGQVLPPDKMTELETSRQTKLAEISREGDVAKGSVRGCKTCIGNIEVEILALEEKLAKINIERDENITNRDKRLPIIEAAIENNVTIKPENDLVCVSLSEHIFELAGEIGETASNQLAGIEENRRSKSRELAEIEKTLAAPDQAKKNAERIAELEQQEKDLAQAIADIEKEIADIDQYKKAESGLITEAVNGKFKYVTFKLFNTLLNGSIEDCCEAILNGTPYPDMSGGEKNFVGIDIINVLSKHYDLSVPLFIDNAESMTLPIEAKSQVIELHAVPGIKELTIQEANVKAVA